MSLAVACDRRPSRQAAVVAEASYLKLDVDHRPLLDRAVTDVQATNSKVDDRSLLSSPVTDVQATNSKVDGAGAAAEGGMSEIRGSSGMSEAMGKDGISENRGDRSLLSSPVTDVHPGNQ